MCETILHDAYFFWNWRLRAKKSQMELFVRFVEELSHALNDWFSFSGVRRQLELIHKRIVL